MSIRRVVLGEGHELVSQTLDLIGNEYYDLGDLEKAKQYHQTSSENRVKEVGEDDTSVAQSLQLSGISLQNLSEH